MSKRNVKAIIFDLDGTLVDSEPNYYEADRKVLAQYGITGFDLAMKSKYIGIGAKEMMEDIKVRYKLQETVENLVSQKNKYYLEIARKNTPVFPEMRKLLGLLEECQYPLALASGSSPEVIDVILNGTNLKQYFETVLSAEEVKNGKPAPDIFLEAARRIDVSPAECVVVEDSRYGIMAAKAAGMYCIAIPGLPEAPLAEEYMTADLLFRKGISEFSAEKAFRWIESSSC